MSPEFFAIIAGVFTVGIGLAGLMLTLFQILRREHNASISNLERVMTVRFDAQDKRMERIETRLDIMDGRIGRLEQTTAALSTDMQTAKSDMQIIKAHLLPAQTGADNPALIERVSASD